MRRMGLFVCILVATAGPALARMDLVKGDDGKTIAVILDCDRCKDPKVDPKCETGVVDGFHGGAACGECLLKVNSKVGVSLPYDVTLKGQLKDENGQPIKGQFVKLHTPKYGVRTKTIDDGIFYIRLGSSDPGKNKKLLFDLGTRTVRKDGKSASEYSFVMMPEKYEPCDSSQKQPPKKADSKKAGKKK